MLTSHFIDNGDLQSAYSEIGSGFPFLLVHGFTGSKLDFRDQLEWFEDARRVIAFDQRGHGESSNHPPYQLDQMVIDLVGFLNALDIETCDLLGHSMGGMVALRAVLQHPDRFRSLILMDTTPLPVKLMDEGAWQTLKGLIQKEGCQAMLESMRGQSIAPAVQRSIDYLGESEHWRRIRVKLTQMDPAAFIDLGGAMEHQASLVELLPEIDCPATVIVGKHDQPFVKPSKLMANKIPNATLQIIPKAAHSPQYENPEAWKHAVRQHLAGL